jgi:hypothetical protein
LSEKANKERYELVGEVFVLDEPHRAFIENHLGLQVREPPKKPRPKSWFYPSLVVSMEKLGLFFRHLFRKLTTGRRLRSEELSSSEEGFVAALTQVFDVGLLPQAGKVSVNLVHGGFGGWRFVYKNQRQTRLIINRLYPQVISMIEAWTRDPASLYPALMVLCDGQDAFGLCRKQAAERLVGLPVMDATEMFFEHKTKRLP